MADSDSSTDDLTLPVVNELTLPVVNETTASDPRPLPPADFFDPVIEVYKKDVDRTLLRENLKLTPQQRCEQFERMMETIFELHRQAARRQEES